MFVPKKQIVIPLTLHSQLKEYAHAHNEDMCDIAERALLREMGDPTKN